MKTRIAVLMTMLFVLVAACGTPQTQVGRSAKTGAGIGALAGLVFGGDLSDVVAGAAIGGLGGAAVGSAKSSEQQDAARTEIARQEATANARRENERLAMEQDAQARAAAQVEYEQRLRVERERLVAEQQSASADGAIDANWLADPEMLVRAFGEDNVTGLYALRDCQHDTAIIAASAAENSTNASYQLTSVWLRAMVAVDLNRTVSANTAYRQLIVVDPEVLTMEEAESAAVDALAAVRADRAASGIVCKT
jgi:hypothetical protein